MSKEDATQGETTSGAFPPTHWTVLAAAKGDVSTERRAALSFLAGRYWKPVYCFVRRSGSDEERAKDLTQEFFAFALGNELEWRMKTDAKKGSEPASRFGLGTRRVTALGDNWGAVALFDQAIGIFERLVNQEGRCELANNLASVYQNKAVTLKVLGDNSGAVALYDQAIKIRERLVDQEGRRELAAELSWRLPKQSRCA